MEQNDVIGVDEFSAAGPGVAGSEVYRLDDAAEDPGEAEPEEVRTEISRAPFEQIGTQPVVRNSLNLDFILDIPLTLTVELGRSRLLINELLQLGQGSVIELTKLAGEPVDIFVNRRLIARGEVVVVNEKFGVRLTDVVSQAERVNRLR